MNCGPKESTKVRHNLQEILVIQIVGIHFKDGDVVFSFNIGLNSD